jgi:hypothetical protein
MDVRALETTFFIVQAAFSVKGTHRNAAGKNKLYGILLHPPPLTKEFTRKYAVFALICHIKKWSSIQQFVSCMAGWNGK